MKSLPAVVRLSSPATMIKRYTANYVAQAGNIIRSLHKAREYEVFELPFCMRCPEVIVAAVNDVISEARKIEKLGGRIDKPYRHFEPVKGKDSKLYPKIWLVKTTVQRK